MAHKSYALQAEIRRGLQQPQSVQPTSRRLLFDDDLKEITPSAAARYTNSMAFAQEKYNDQFGYSTASREERARVMAAYKAKIAKARGKTHHKQETSFLSHAHSDLTPTTPFTNETGDEEISDISSDGSFEGYRVKTSPIPLDFATPAPDTSHSRGDLYTSEAEDSDEENDRITTNPVITIEETPAGIVIGRRTARRELFPVVTKKEIPTAYSPVNLEGAALTATIPSQEELWEAEMRKMTQLLKPKASSSAKPSAAISSAAAAARSDGEELSPIEIPTTTRASGEDGWLAARAAVKSFDPSALASDKKLTVANPDRSKRATRSHVATVGGAGGAAQPRSSFAPQKHSSHLTGSHKPR